MSSIHSLLHLRTNLKVNARDGKIRLLSFISLLMGFAQAFFLYVMSTYLRFNSGLENVSVFYLVSYILTLAIFLNLHKIIRKIGKEDVFYFSLFFKTVCIAFLLFSPTGWLSIIPVMLYIIFGNLEWVSLDAILETYSSDRMSGRIRGKFLTLMNTGVLLGPFLSTRILEKFDYYGIFLLLLIFNVIISAMAIAKIKKSGAKFTRSLRARDAIKKMTRRKNIARIFYISFILEFFYALMIIYTPIYLINLGLDWSEIGVIFTMMLLPFIFIQYPMGVAADKKFGEKEFLIFVIVLMGLATLAAFFISSASVVLWSVILFSTRIGAALIEILRDSYFYKRIKGTDVDMIDLFRAARPVAYIISAFISAILLLFFPVKAVFLLVAIVVFSSLIPAAYLVDNASEAEMEKMKRL